MNKLFIIFIITLSFITCICSLHPTKVTADSGFDTSYDSGGWSSSDSNWSSSSSSNSDGEPMTFEEFVIMIIIFSIIIGISILGSLVSKTLDKIFPNRKRNREKKYAKLNSLDIKSHDVDENIIKKYIPDFDRQQFLNDRYSDYLKVQNDWMNFNYDSLKENLTDELYNQYEMQLDTLKVKNQKNIMKDFNLINSGITNIREENGTIIVDLEMIVSFIDYIEQSGKCVRGSMTNKVFQHYSMTFVMQPESPDKCPNCGGELDDNSTQICSYCRSKITRLGSIWVLSKKQSLKQR